MVVHYDLMYVRLVDWNPHKLWGHGEWDLHNVPLWKHRAVDLMHCTPDERVRSGQVGTHKNATYHWPVICMAVVKPERSQQIWFSILISVLLDPTREHATTDCHRFARTRTSRRVGKTKTRLDHLNSALDNYMLDNYNWLTPDKSDVVGRNPN